MSVPLLLPLMLIACTEPSGESASESPIETELFSRGEDRGAGNLLGIHPFVTTHDYASPEAFDAVLRPLFEDAALAGLFGPETVAVLPEYLGTWLVVVDESQEVLDAETTGDAMTAAVVANIEAFLEASGASTAEDTQTAGVFAMKADRVAEVYQDVLGSLAADYGVTLVGGSVLLPEPVVADGAILPTAGGAIRNASFVFGPDGALLGTPAIKAFPTEDEAAFVAAGAVADLPVYETAAGRLGVLVCADSWFPEAYAHYADRVDLLAVPVFGSGDDTWGQVWQGYSGWEEPSDVDLADVGVLTEEEAWERYSLPGRMEASGAAAGITVPLRGDLWDLGSDGRAFVVDGDGSAEAPARRDALLVNLWL